MLNYKLEFEILLLGSKALNGQTPSCIKDLVVLHCQTDQFIFIIFGFKYKPKHLVVQILIYGNILQYLLVISY